MTAEFSAGAASPVQTGVGTEAGAGSRRPWDFGASFPGRLKGLSRMPENSLARFLGEGKV